jgi:hypothetical protein
LSQHPVANLDASPKALPASAVFRDHQSNKKQRSGEARLRGHANATVTDAMHSVEMREIIAARVVR